MGKKRYGKVAFFTSNIFAVHFYYNFLTPPPPPKKKEGGKMQPLILVPEEKAFIFINNGMLYSLKRGLSTNLCKIIDLGI